MDWLMISEGWVHNFLAHDLGQNIKAEGTCVRAMLTSWLIRNQRKEAYRKIPRFREKI